MHQRAAGFVLSSIPAASESFRRLEGSLIKPPYPLNEGTRLALLLTFTVLSHPPTLKKVGLIAMHHQSGFWTFLI